MKKIDDRVLDDYDGGDPPPPEYIEKLLKNAPPAVRKRAEEFANGKADGQAAAEERPLN